ncbi:diacylglycerol kinase family protein [Solitalea lacus]|uniref:diacylglycerol kinase family protein n=1 Tax=Solitalea lacus TaxID=2911172 RepID=UPI001EDAE2A8|nr:diacylglycerol kinase family protein [Solitalea lacus]UKJ05816.1 diacylglycerol kinase family protein [Solitalea lacus]
MSHSNKNLFRTLSTSFSYAINGIMQCFSSELNFKIHLIVTLLVCLAGLMLKINSIEWCIIMLSIGFTLAMELINTAIEKLADTINPEFDSRIGIVKDIAAGAVLITAISAVIVGLIIFLPKII